MKRRAALSALAALLGIALTAAITWGATLLFSQPIGLASQPASVIETLAPRGVQAPSRSTARAPKHRHPAAVSTRTPARATAPAGLGRSAASGGVSGPTAQPVAPTTTTPAVRRTVTAPIAPAGRVPAHDDSGGAGPRTAAGGDQTTAGRARTQADD